MVTQWKIIYSETILDIEATLIITNALTLILRGLQCAFNVHISALAYETHWFIELTLPLPKSLYF